MEYSLYVFLLTLFTAHYKPSKSEFISCGLLKNGVQQMPLDIISSTAAANRETKSNVFFNGDCQSSDNFEIFSYWTCNAPQMSKFGSALLVTKPSTTTAEKRYRILVFGGIFTAGDVLNSNQTWIYYEETNSWKMIDSVVNGPPAMKNLQLVPLCSSHAVIVHADAINSTWIFSYEQLEWKRVTIVGNGPSPLSFAIDNSNVTAVAVKSAHFLCPCSEDVLVFVSLHEADQLAVVWYRLSCVIEHTKYSWKKVGNYTFPDYDLRFLTSSSDKTTLYFMVHNCIWDYSVKKSFWHKTNYCLSSDKWYEVANRISMSIYLDDTREILMFSLWKLLVVRLSLSNGSVFYERAHGNLCFNTDLTEILLGLQLYAVRVVSQGNEVIVYSPDTLSKSCGSTTWRLRRNDGAGKWEFADVSNTVLIPLGAAFQSLWKDTYYRMVYGIIRTIPPPAMWSMNLRTKQWQMVGYLNVTGLLDVRAMADYYSVSTHLQENVWLIAAVHYTTLIASKDHIRQTFSPKPPRHSCTLVTISSSSALLFGGIFDNGSVTNDLYQFSLTGNVWEKVEMAESAGKVPSPRCGHAATVLGFDMFVFGGYDGSKIFNQELWKYNLINNSWSILVPKNKLPRSSISRDCHLMATGQAGMIWIATKCIASRGHFEYDGHYELWMFVVHLQTWNFVAHHKMEKMPNYCLSPTLHFRQGYLLDLQASTLVRIKAGCPEGLNSSNISRVPCDLCKIGFFSGTGSNECRKCPNGTTTREEGSSTLTDCNVCVKGYCLHGRCLVVSSRLTQVPVCTCTFGFTGSHCQDATYYYIGMGVILFIGIITLFVIVLWRTRKRRRERETALRRHIQTLNDAWQISWQEIELQDKIGGGVSGRVWKAQYRDMDVAVKMLIDVDQSQSSLEFAGEIKFMQTMRHPNIVLFIGAGRTSPRAQPFLVVEFAHRGSLRHVLDDVSIEINENRKIDFALDASKGMEFLHQLDPPRIHRDVKSENLLVSRSWIVKVTDFGLGKLFCGAHQNQQLNRRNSLISIDSENELLSEPRDMSEDGIGTVRWSAPELSRRESYDGSIDVYSFGIVLWEIWSRGFPFKQYRFGHEVDDAVERGERPVVPDDCPKVYATLMQACWADNAWKRPSFSEVVSCLENMYVEDACMLE